MVASRIIRRKGATIAVTANAEVLFMPGGSVNGWMRRFTNRVEKFTAEAAPVNSRPRWAHYGKPLKRTIVGNVPWLRNLASGPRLYSAVGSTAPHAAYVDQGTGARAGGSPWRAKILPPTTRGGDNLYEHTWRPAGPGGRPVRSVYIKGQKGQFFFDKGLERGFKSMRMRSAQVPNDPRVGNIMRTWPRRLENFIGNTPADGPFLAQLKEWRAWRDASWTSYRGADWQKGGTKQSYKAGPSKPRKKATAATTTKPKSKPKVEKPPVTKPKPKPEPTVSLAEMQQGAERWLRANKIPASRARSFKFHKDGTFTFAYRNVRGIWSKRTGRWDGKE